jgi:hypothetical protein
MKNVVKPQGAYKLHKQWAFINPVSVFGLNASHPRVKLPRLWLWGCSAIFTQAVQGKIGLHLQSSKTVYAIIAWLKIHKSTNHRGNTFL